MATLADAIALAMRHQQSGQQPVAERIYGPILVVEPDQADETSCYGLWSNRGV
jgi:hypothetical protein